MMATRRPRVKVAANLSIRRPTKSTNNTSNAAGETIKQEADVTPAEPVQEEIVPRDVSELLPSAQAAPSEDTPVPQQQQQQQQQDVKPIPAVPPSMVPEAAPPEETFQEFKLPKPPDVNPPTALPSLALPGFETFATGASSNSYNAGDEPMSPRKQEASRPPTFTLPLARKRNRTESLTSNKSLPEGVTVNKVTRKVATKQEESQRTLDSKKEIRKRLTNIENVDKQNLTMFDMIYYNPSNNPMTPPALASKRGSLENIAKAADGREGGLRSRSVSKSRSPTPAPSGSAPMGPPKPATTPAPVTLTPQLKLGPNGEMILDEASLVIENEREKEMRETLANADIVYQDEFSGNSGYYSRIRRTKDWGDEETIRFYRSLKTVGTDFSMMLSLFPQRSRRDLKLKFKKEERINLSLVNKALLHPSEFNVDDLRQQFAEEDEQLEKQRQEEQQRKMDAMEQQQKEKLRKNLMMRMSVSNSPQRRLSKAERVMSDGLELVEGGEPKKPKRRAATRKRAAAKSEPVPTDSEGNAIAPEGVSEAIPVNPEPDTDDAPKEEAAKKRKRAPVPSKRTTAKQAAIDAAIAAAATSVATVTTAVVMDSEEQQQQLEPLLEEKAAIFNAQYEDSSSPVPKQRHSVKQENTNTVEEPAQQQSEYVPECIYHHHNSILSDSFDSAPMDTTPADSVPTVSIDAAPKKPSTPVSSPSYRSPSPASDIPMDTQTDSIEHDSLRQEKVGGLAAMKERTNITAQWPMHHGAAIPPHKPAKQTYWQRNRHYGAQNKPAQNDIAAPERRYPKRKYWKNKRFYGKQWSLASRGRHECADTAQENNGSHARRNSKRRYWQKKRFYGKPRPKKREKPPPERQELIDLPEYDDAGLIVKCRTENALPEGESSKQLDGKPQQQLEPSKQKDTPPPDQQEQMHLPGYNDAVIIKKDRTEDAEQPADGNVAPEEGPFDVPPATSALDQPYVMYEPPAVATYESAANLDHPIVKYQCMEDYEGEAAYRPASREMMTTGNGGSTASSTASATIVPPAQDEDDSITVITLQNLDDQTHTTCLRTDVAPSVQPTLINELTPVEIKYDEYDPDGALVLALDGEQGGTVKEEHQLYNAPAQGEAALNRMGGAPLNVQVINWPPEAGTSTIPYVVYGNMESYGCSGDTIIIPESVRNHVVEYEPLTQTIVNIAPMVGEAGGSAPSVPTSMYAAVELASVQTGQSNTQTSIYSADAAIVHSGQDGVVHTTLPSTSGYGPVDVTPKHELANPPAQSDVPPSAHDVDDCEITSNSMVKAAPADEVEIATSEAEPCQKRDPVEEGDTEEAQEKEEQEEEEDGEGGFSLDDIDINSLVLVESQDGADPNKTFYEIYISNPDTGQLSEKPLDVPADVIESIRQILEASAGGGGAAGGGDEEGDDR